MTRKKMTALLSLMFVTGVLIGGVAGAILQMEYMKRNPFKFGPPPPPPSLKEGLLRRLKTELDLSEKQVADISPVLDKLHQNLENLRKRNHPLIEERIQAANKEMETFLAPEQITKLREFHEKMKKRFDEHEKRHANGDGPPPPPPDEGFGPPPSP